MNDFLSVLFGFFVGMIVAAIITSVFDSQFESARCDKLADRLDINLVYTYNSGCVFPEDL